MKTTPRVPLESRSHLTFKANKISCHSQMRLDIREQHRPQSITNPKILLQVIFSLLLRWNFS